MQSHPHRPAGCTRLPYLTNGGKTIKVHNGMQKYTLHLQNTIIFTYLTDFNEC